MKKILFLLLLALLPFQAFGNKGKLGSPTSKPKHPSIQKARFNVGVASAIGKRVDALIPIIPIETLQQSSTSLFGEENPLKSTNFFSSKSAFDQAILAEERRLKSKDPLITIAIGAASGRLGAAGMAGGISFDGESTNMSWPGTKAPYRWEQSPKGWFLLSGDQKKCFLDSGDRFILPVAAFARSKTRDLIDLSKTTAIHPAFAAHPTHRVWLSKSDLAPGKFAPLGRRWSGRTWNISNHPSTPGIRIHCADGGLRVTQMPALRFRFYRRLGSLQNPAQPMQPWSFLLTYGQEKWMSKEYLSLYQYLYHLRALNAILDPKTTINHQSVDQTSLTNASTAYFNQRVRAICSRLVRITGAKMATQSMLKQAIENQKELLNTIKGNTSENYEYIARLNLPKGCAYQYGYYRYYGRNRRSMQHKFICHGETYSFPPSLFYSTMKKKENTLCSKFFL